MEAKETSETLVYTTLEVDKKMKAHCEILVETQKIELDLIGSKLRIIQTLFKQIRNLDSIEFHEKGMSLELKEQNLMRYK